jgi:hypothetical protein
LRKKNEWWREEERGEKREKPGGLGLASKWKSVNHETSGM